ncbi:hypothetical protein LWI29_032306 [Acer saccharum]|uniref:Cation-transporting P-type ATPase C-terminal domain-containing protein n=1 Tax=Acer saccharum TaxID=4024 RepID=A0AA39SW42_ACESA|nr:hypothetical protein LWI29_032306 [Acer saccharum]
MDTLGALALATEPRNEELKKRTPVGRKGNFISNVMWRNIMGQSLYQFKLIWLLQRNGEAVFGLVGPDSGLDFEHAHIINFLHEGVGSGSGFLSLVLVIMGLGVLVMMNVRLWVMGSGFWWCVDDDSG